LDSRNHGQFSCVLSADFCRDLDAISRKQGAKRRSVLAHVTERSNEVDEERATKREQKGAQAPLDSRNHGQFSCVLSADFCRDLDAISRKQDMKGKPQQGLPRALPLRNLFHADNKI
jgi:hypothetical protein